MRGYHVHSTMMDRIRKTRLEVNFRYFEEMRLRQQVDAQILIAYSWRRIKKRQLRLALQKSKSVSESKKSATKSSKKVKNTGKGKSLTMRKNNSTS